MKTHEILTTSEANLVAQLKDMKIKELERHAEKLLNGNGQPDYDAVMLAVIQAVPNLNSNNPDCFLTVQRIVRSHLPVASNDASEDVNLVERITVILMVIIKKKFQKIHTSAPTRH